MNLELKDVAKSLSLPVGTIERWIRQGRIPIKSRGNECVFDEDALKRWAKSHNLSFIPPEKEGNTPDDTNETTLSNLASSMKRGYVIKDISGQTAETIFTDVSDRLPGVSDKDKDELIERLLQREEMVSTGIGKGIAIPHPRSPLPHMFESPVIITCFLKKAIAFKAIDDKPVSIMFFLLSPDTECHLHLLSRLSYCLRDNEFSEFLRSFPGPDELYQAVYSLEEQIDKADKR